MHVNYLRFGFTVFIGVLLIAGCAGRRTETETAMEAAEGTIAVSLSDYRIDMPDTVKAGMLTFSVRNTGSHPHNFEIEGNGVEVKLPTDLQAGESGTLEANLKAGTYRVYCPVADHAAKGMDRTLTVTE